MDLRPPNSLLLGVALATSLFFGGVFFLSLNKEKGNTPTPAVQTVSKTMVTLYPNMNEKLVFENIELHDYTGERITFTTKEGELIRYAGVYILKYDR